MDNRPTRIFLLAIVAVAIFIFRTAAQMPPIVAAHFGPDGAANGWMARESYRNLMLGCAVLLPLALAVSTLWLVRRAPQLINLPNREYWFSPEHAQQSRRLLEGHLLRLATVLAIFLAAVHYLVLRAHASQPPRLPLPAFTALLLTFLVLVLLVVLSIRSQFRMPQPRLP